MVGVDPFGTLPDGTKVARVTLRGGGLAATFLTWGAVLQDLRLEGHGPSLVLGLKTLDDYLAHSRYFGATAGRCANRIRDGRFTLDGLEYQADRNFLGKHTLHGGADGMGKRVWTIDQCGADHLTLSIVLPDGHMGFPGNLTARASFTLADGALDIRYSATTDAPTLCNLAHHTYWVLDDSGTILNHRLRIAADAYTATDAELIPTGNRSVDGSDYDFRVNRRIGDVSDRLHIDTNFCLSNARNALRPVAWIDSPDSGVAMTVATTEPGLQIYDAAPLDVPVPGVDDRALKAHAGLAVEPQVWPDAINNPDFPSAVLRPGEEYAQHSRFEFSRG